MPSANTVSEETADMVLFGHIHTPYVQKIYHRTLINIGSVGNSTDSINSEDKNGNYKATTVANYCILKGNIGSKNIEEPVSYELVSIPYDIEKELGTNEDNYDKEAYAYELQKGVYRDMDKVIKTLIARRVSLD